jgi:uncharacterized protein YebE (UPF0316 family)
MNLSTLAGTEAFNIFILPLLIFLARILDVSIGTMRIIYVSRGHKILAPILAMFEVLIWLIAIGQIMQNLTSVHLYLAYSGGYAAGNYIGMYLEEKLAVGHVFLRVITGEKVDEVIELLKQYGNGVTSNKASSATGEVTIIFSIIKRKYLDEITGKIRKINPDVFYSVGDVKSISNEPFLYTTRKKRFNWFGPKRK